MTREELERARDLGAATYLSAYVQLMASHLEIADVTQDAMNSMALLMTEPMNHAMTITWCAMMGDHKGVGEGFEKFKEALHEVTFKGIE